MMASHPPWPPDYHWVYPDCTLAALPHQRTENKLKEHESFMSSPREGRKVIFIAWDLAHLTDCCCLCSPPQFYDGNHQVIRRSLESAEIMSLSLWRLCNRTCQAYTISGIRRKISQHRFIHLHFMEFSLKIRRKTSKSSIWQFISMSEPAADWCY